MEGKSFEVKESGYTTAGNIQTDSGILEELNGLGGSFDRIKIPAGGSLMFEAVGEEGEPILVKEIEGVILHHHPVNSYYKDEYTGGSNPPDCGSMDGKLGVGTPGGSCWECPYNKFGSRKEGRGKLCKNKRRIFLLREGEMLPLLLTLPTGSLKGFSEYMKRLLTKGKMCCSVVTRIELSRAVSGKGVQFNRAVFSYVRDLTSEEKEALIPVVKYVKDYSGSLALEGDFGSDTEMKVNEDGEIING